MSWMATLYKTYEQALELEGKKPWPLSHMQKQAHIEIVLDGDGKLKRGRISILPGEAASTLIPVTEASAGRTRGIAPHPLCEELGYCTREHSKEEKEKNTYDLYIKQIKAWQKFDSENHKLNAIVKYLESGRLWRDLSSEIQFPISFKTVKDGKSQGSVSELYAWAADCCGEAGPRRCPPDHADEMEPSQIAVQVLRGDAAIAAQETFQLAVAAIDRLDVEGIPDPLSGRKVQGFVANAHGRSAGRIAAMTVRHQNDVGIQNRFEHRLQGLGVDRRKNLADGCAAAVGGDQNRHLFVRQTALAGLSSTLARLAIQGARSLVALKHIGLVNFDNALEFRPILSRCLQETVPPAEGRIDAKTASAGRFTNRLALGQRQAE